MHSSLVLAFAGLASAHFELLHPTPFYHNDATQGQGPCGGRDPNFPDNDDDLFEYHIGGEDFATILTHERSAWLIRVTTDREGPREWEQVFPIYTQSGLGSFCQPRVALPEKYENETGIISVVSSATDGILYSCVLAKFVSGTGEEFDECSNGTANGYFSNDDRLAALVGNDTSEDSGSSGSGGDSGDDSDDDSSDDGGDDGGSDNDEGDGAMALKAWGVTSTLVTLTAMALVGGTLLA